MIDITNLQDCIRRYEAELKQIVGRDLHLIIDFSHEGMSLESLAEIVSRALHIELQSLFTISRKTDIMEARQVCFYLSKRYIANMTTVAIGRFFNLDHSSVVYGIKKLQGVTEANNATLYWKIQDAEAALFNIDKLLKNATSNIHQAE